MVQSVSKETKPIETVLTKAEVSLEKEPPTVSNIAIIRYEDSGKITGAYVPNLEVLRTGEIVFVRDRKKPNIFRLATCLIDSAFVRLSEQSIRARRLTPGEISAYVVARCVPETLDNKYWSDEDYIVGRAKGV